MTPPEGQQPELDLKRDRAQLAAWLAEWELDHAMRNADPASDLDQPETPAPPRAGTRIAVAAGQIRLLHPGSCSVASARPVYVLVLPPLSRTSVILVPFSRFSEPAIPEEWRSGLRALHIRVLCFWNARQVANPVLDGSWVTTRLSRTRLEQIDQWLRAPRHSPEFLRKAGPPLRHPLDPRWQYLAGDAADFDTLGARWPLLRNTGCSTPTVYPDHAAGKDLLKAAESHTEYGEDA